MKKHSSEWFSSDKLFGLTVHRFIHSVTIVILKRWSQLLHLKTTRRFGLDFSRCSNLNLNVSYHDREDNSSHSWLEDPEQSQAEDLDEGEEMDLPEGNMSQVNQVRLMFRRHQKQLKTIHKLETGSQTRLRYKACMSVTHSKVLLCLRQENNYMGALPALHWERRLPCIERLHKAQASG